MSLTFPDGAVATGAPWGSFGADWPDISQWQEEIEAAAVELGVPPERLAAHMVIESQGDPTAIQKNNENGWSYGLLQVVARWHKALIEKLAGKKFATEAAAGQALLDNPALAVRAGAAVLKGQYEKYGDWDKASSSFFLGNPDWRGSDSVNDTTGPAYRKALNGLISELATTATTAPPSSVDPVKVITGGVPLNGPIFPFGSPNYDSNGNPMNLYHYGVGHGTTAPHIHTGDDWPLPPGTKLYAPLPGVIRCVGNQGQGDWGQGCGSFADTVSGGVGNVTLLTDAGLKLTYGHVNKALVSVGQRVAAGQAVATSGGMFSPHLHLDVSRHDPARVNHAIAINEGDYFLYDPVPTLQRAMGGGSVPDPLPLNYRISLIPAGNRNRPGTPINTGGPRYVTVHETGNTRVGADAEMHRDFTHRGGGDESVSFHLVVDEREAIQLLPFSEIGWHAGDGCDDRPTDWGCFDSIGIETCVNSDGNWEQTLRNLTALLVRLIREKPTLSPDRIRQHYDASGKNCPQRIRAEGRWNTLIANVRRELAGAPEPEFVGLPDWLPPEYFKAAFPSADPAGVVTKKVIEIVNDTERVPWFRRKVDVAPSANLWEFDGFTLLNQRSKVWLEGDPIPE